MRDPYEVLGVSKTASAAEIKSAFRRQAKKLHPDANKHDPKAATRFAELNAAYEIVGDDWDIEALPMAPPVKILAVADAFETLQMATPVRPAFTRWSALEEVEKGAGRTFAREAVRALRVVAGRPEVTAPAKALKVV